MSRTSAMEQLYDVTKFDFSVTFVYSGTSDDDKLSCFFVGSHNLFDDVTNVRQMAQRFQHLFEQIFRRASSDILMDESIRPISKLSLIPTRGNG